MRHRIPFPIASLVIAGTALLSACNREEARTAGQESREVARSTTDAVGDKTRDMTITSAVKMRLAQDPDLSALSINVDTEAGRVVLRGSAPTTAARTKASDLAGAVDGVTAVNNELSVQTR